LWPINSRGILQENGEAIIGKKKKKPSYNCAEKQIESKKEKKIKERKEKHKKSYLSFMQLIFIIFHINVQ
jgi:cytoskeletal protein RodZ